VSDMVTNGHGPTALPGSLDPAQMGARVPSNADLYAEIVDFLIDEASLLDHNRFDEWLGILTEDVTYLMPVRRTVTRAQGLGFDPLMTHINDTFETLGARVGRLHSESAFSEDPPSRCRRFVSNVTVHETVTEGEYSVGSYELLMRSRWDATEFDFVPVERQDVLRRSGTSFKVARRMMYCDQSLLNTPNLGVFL